jgi:hypothetical protein
MRVKVRTSSGVTQFRTTMTVDEFIDVLEELENKPGKAMFIFEGMGNATHLVSKDNLEYMEVVDD